MIVNNATTAVVIKPFDRFYKTTNIGYKSGYSVYKKLNFFYKMVFVRQFNKKAPSIKTGLFHYYLLSILTSFFNDILKSQLVIYLVQNGIYNMRIN